MGKIDAYNIWYESLLSFKKLKIQIHNVCDSTKFREIIGVWRVGVAPLSFEVQEAEGGFLGVP